VTPSKNRLCKIGVVFAGGGARGFAHAGILRGLNHIGIFPDVLVGVSMGAVVAATYGLNPDWYQNIRSHDLTGYPQVAFGAHEENTSLIQKLLDAEQIISHMYFGWGLAEGVVDWSKTLVKDFTLDKNLEESSIPVIVTATDLISGRRIAMRSGNAAEALRASTAIAGIVPPVEMGDMLLADGGYADLVPVDLARAAGADFVIAVDPSIPEDPVHPGNAIAAMLRAFEICQEKHGHLRFGEADMILHPKYSRTIDTLDFQHRRLAIAAGIRCARAKKTSILEKIEAQ